MKKDRHRLMSKPLKGTTNLAFVFNGGIMLAVESRTTYGDQGKHVLFSDEENKLLPLNSESTIVCTLAGVVSEWYTMYNRVNNSAPASAEEASLTAYKYMTTEIDHEYLEDFRDMWKRELMFGTLIAGKDFQLYRVTVDEENNVRKLKINFEAIGSGAKYAKFVLCDGHTAESYGINKDLTVEQAIELALKAAFYATVPDKFSGGYIKVYHMDENGCKEVVRSQMPLDVYYEYYNLYDIDECTIFLLYSTNFKPYFAEEDLKDLIDAIWPTGEIERRHFAACHLVAKKRDLYFHRLVLDLEEDVPYAYDLIKNQAPPHDSGVLGGKFLACQLGLERETETGGTDHVTVYLEKSSRDLLQLICKLEDPDNLVYN